MPIPKHKSEEAYERYQYDQSYVESIIEEMGKTRGSDVIDKAQGAHRLLKKLAAKHPDEYISVAKSKGLAVNGYLDSLALYPT